jgi:hypothetical protein
MTGRAVKQKITHQVHYVTFRDNVVMGPSERGERGGRGKKQIAALKSALPAADPGSVVIYRWHLKFFRKDEDGKYAPDQTKIAVDRVDFPGCHPPVPTLSRPSPRASENRSTASSQPQQRPRFPLEPTRVPQPSPSQAAK